VHQLDRHLVGRAPATPPACRPSGRPCRSAPAARPLRAGPCLPRHRCRRRGWCKKPARVVDHDGRLADGPHVIHRRAPAWRRRSPCRR
jgi:hypothetical protein